MKKITNEQWEKVTEELKSYFGHVAFRYKDAVVAVYRGHVSEGKTELIVYINGKICGAWLNKDNPMHALTTVLWRKRTKAVYSAKTIKRIEKDFKRDAKKYYPDLNNHITYYTPCFLKAASIVRQYKKLSGLELLSIGGANV